VVSEHRTNILKSNRTNIGRVVSEHHSVIGHTGDIRAPNKYSKIKSNEYWKGVVSEHHSVNGFNYVQVLSKSN
jgi:hypothetical protein